MIESQDTHNRIITVLESKGPSLPIQIAKEIGISSLFISAFLSELTGEKRIKISNLKVGGSPLYLLPGQEPLLENFHKYLHPKEIEAYQLLKGKKVLKDNEQSPQIRVALRSIRDFAIGFKKNEEIYWRYANIPSEEIIKILNPKPKKNISVKKEVKTTLKTERPIETIRKQVENFQNPFIIKTKSEKKEKPQSDFVKKIINIISKKYKIIEEKGCKTKEYNCIVQINSDLGPINFYTLAKDKKKISETDLKKLLSESQSIPLPALLVHTGELSKKAKDYEKNYYSILKIIQIKE